MGNARPKPDRLPDKLRQIRLALGLSQTAMLRRLGLEDTIQYARISEYETGIREPTLMILLQYAHAANVWADVLIDDELDLPEKLPSSAKHEGVNRKLKSPSKTRGTS
jgi:transcriptional regulator with XRE-family HTH domain